MTGSIASTSPAELERPAPTARRLAEASISPNTRRAYSGALCRLDAWLDGRPLEDATLGRVPRRARAPASAATSVAAACFRARLAGEPTPAGERTARVLAGYRRTAGSRGRGPARPFGAADLAAVLATCDRPRRRGRGRETEEVALERGRLDAVIVGLLFMGGMRRSEVSALRWADVDDAADGDGVLVTVRRGKTNQEGETRDVRFVKGAVAGAVRTLRAAASLAPEDRVVPLSPKMVGLAVPGGGSRRRRRARDRPLRPGRAGVGAHEPGRINHRRDARRELEDEPDGGALLGRGGAGSMPRGFCRAILVLALTLWAAGGGGCASREPAATAVAREAARGPEPAPPAEQRAEPDGRDGVFRSGIELVNVAATVTDARGRFVDGLTKDDFRVYEDGEPVEITQFDNERVPVSLGIALDTSGSMDDRKMEAARNALDRFLNDLLGPDDEIFLYRFDDRPVLLQDWTTSRDHLSRAIRDIRGQGGTALYDAVAESLPRIAEGRHRKKALLIISDGNDTNSRTNYWNVPSLIRRTEALVYAIGIDVRTVMQRLERIGGRGVSVRALRELTDDSGGRTEIIRHADDLDPATAGIARELSRQYQLAYPVRHAGDGRWHSIRVEVGDPDHRVRARRGYVAAP